MIMSKISHNNSDQDLYPSTFLTFLSHSFFSIKNSLSKQYPNKEDNPKH